jgi:hypothetical protein
MVCVRRGQGQRATVRGLWAHTESRDAVVASAAVGGASGPYDAARDADLGRHVALVGVRATVATVVMQLREAIMQ